MKLFFSLLILNCAFGRDLFVISGPSSKQIEIQSLAKTMMKEEPFTEGKISIRLNDKCERDLESLLHICIDTNGKQTIIHKNVTLLNRIFSEIKKEELSNESSHI
ncbi:MAG: hypothetical protein EP319_00060 [Deltaproteobacteria bacterium]|nr:MAG: hypothetical protein EP319_00060 [Deltaproteobacteria bacterium]